MKPVRPLEAIVSTAWKDIQVLFKDTGLLIIIIGLPMIFSILNGMLNQSTDQKSGDLSIPVVVVNEDDGIYGGQILRILEGIDVLAITELDNRSAAEEQVRDSNAVAAVTLPRDFSLKLAAHESSIIEVMEDPTQQSLAGVVPGILREVAAPVVVQGEVQYAIQNLLASSPEYQSLDAETQSGLAAQSMAVQMAQVQKMMSDPWVSVDATTTEGEDVIVLADNVFSLLVPSFTVLFAFFLVGTISADLLKERQEGSLRRLIAAPVPRWTIIAGKMLAYLVLVLVQVTVIFGVANIFFKMPFDVSLIGFILLTISMGLAATGLGMFIAAVSKTDKQADGLGLLLGFALGGLGGCFTFSRVPIYKSGGTISMISKLTPQAHALNGYDLLLVQDASLVEVLPEVGILLGFALLFLLLATWKFRFEK